VQLLAMIGVRKLLERFYTAKELAALDHRLPKWSELNQPSAARVHPSSSWWSGVRRRLNIKSGVHPSEPTRPSMPSPPIIIIHAPQRQDSDE
jgi:hypothetical protein